MESYVTKVVTLYGSIISDATTQWPTLGRELERDLSYLRRASENRGLEFFTLTLTALGEWFDRSLDLGYLLDSSEIPRGIKLNRGRPCVFRGILARVFGPDGCLKQTADPTAVLYYRTLCQSAKKLEYGVTPATLKKTVKDFFDVEAALPRPWDQTWSSDAPEWTLRSGHPLYGDAYCDDTSTGDLFADTGREALSLPYDTLADLCRRVIRGQLGNVPTWDIEPRHGPGVVSDNKRGSKYCFPTWPRKLESVFPYDWFGSPTIGMPPPADWEPNGKLIAVPKTRKSPRLICAEPSSHQWIQQGLARWIDGRLNDTLLGVSIDLHDQVKSQTLALHASRSRAFATLDLSAASDRLSCRLVEYVFQGTNLLDAFHACRTRAVEQTLDPEAPRLILLRKFSTMGSALTFPIQSIVFTLLSVWALRLHEGRQNDWSAEGLVRDFERVRVFGDDIIVPNDAAATVKLVLHECGLLVNAAKSFTGDHFREACGCDAFDGVDVTPPRHKRPYDGSAETTAALIQYSNNLFLKGFWSASEHVLGWLPPSELRLLAICHPSRAGLGLVSFCGDSYAHLPVKYNEAHQLRHRVRLSFTSKVSRTDDQDESRLLQFYTEDPASSDILEREFEWSPGRPIPQRLRKSRSRVYAE